MAVCRAAEGSDVGVGELCEEAVAYNHSNHWAYFNLAAYHMRAERPKDALKNLHCCLSCLYLLKTTLPTKMGDSKVREIDLGRAISYCPNNLEARLLRILVYIEHGRWRKAQEDVHFAVKEAPNNQQLHALEEKMGSEDTPERLTVGLFEQISGVLGGHRTDRGFRL